MPRIMRSATLLAAVTLLLGGDAAIAQQEPPKPEQTKKEKTDIRDNLQRTRAQGMEKTGPMKKKGVGEAEETRQEVVGKQEEKLLQQMEHEEDKHRTRVARLERIQKIMDRKGNTEALAKATELLAKENQRYEKKMAMMRAKSDVAASRFASKIASLEEEGGDDDDTPDDMSSDGDR